MTISWNSKNSDINVDEQEIKTVILAENLEVITEIVFIKSVPLEYK